jgi:2-haloacid dehalogenase
VSVRAVCFDLLSALLDSWSVWDAVAAELGAGALGRPWRQHYLTLTSTAGAYRPYLDLVAEAAVSVGLPAAAGARLEQRWDTLRPWPDVGLALASLGLPSAVVTNCSETLGRRAAACVGVPFPVVVTAEAAGAYKPDPVPYRLACERLGVPPGEVAYVAGSPFDACGALLQGFDVTWVNRLRAPVPADLSTARTVETLTDWTPT